jgi:hypothetical protein
MSDWQSFWNTSPKKTIMEDHEKEALPVKVIKDADADLEVDNRMTNAQAAAVHSLAAKVGEQIEGGLSEKEAAKKIDELLKEKGMDAFTPPHQDTDGEVSA